MTQKKEPKQQLINKLEIGHVLNSRYKIVQS